MIHRRKIMFASLAGVLLPFCAVQAQPAPEPGREGAPPERGPARPGPEENHRPQGRPQMPPPRHETRPSPPHGEGYRWRDGHWSWDGNRWVWISGRWYR